MRNLWSLRAAKTSLALLLVVSLFCSGTNLGAYADSPELPSPIEQLEDTVPLEGEVEQLVDQVPLAPELQETLLNEEVPAEGSDAANSVLITFSLSSEPSASWLDGSTDDKIVELDSDELLGDALPELPVTSDDTLEFEGWQTEGFERTYSQSELETEVFDSSCTLYAVFRAVTPDDGQARAASGTSGSCTWTIDNNGKLTIQPTNGSSGALGQPAGSMPCWPWQTSNYPSIITSVQVKSGVVANAESWSLFRDLSKMTSCDLSGLNTANVTNMANMFYNCASLTTLNLSNFNTAKVTTMEYMFYMYDKCSLKTLDLSSFRTSRVENMKFMFRGCSSLTSLNISSFDTSNVTNMHCMFEKCSSLTSLDLTKLNTAKVTIMGHMFDGCSSLKSLNLSSFNTANVTDMGYMFQNCQSLTYLNISSFKTPKVTTMGWMFYNCYALPSINVSSFDTSKVTNMHSMFCGCLALTELNISNFNTSSATDMSFLVAYDPVLTKVTFPSTFTVPANANIFQMFYNSPKITEIPASFNFGTTSSAGTETMFSVLSGNPVVTTYNGSDQRVKNYDWPADNRALKGLALTGSVTISGDASVPGKTLTTTVSFGNACRNAKTQYQWYRATNSAGSNAQAVSGAITSTYTTTDADAGKYLVCKVTDGLGAYTGTLSSTGAGPVKIPFSATVQITGDKRTGTKLEASVSGQNSGSEALSYQWYRADNATGSGAVAVSGATQSVYTQVDADRGKFLSCEVKVTNTSAWTGAVRSGWYGPSLTTFSATVQITGDKRTGTKLEASVSGQNSGSEALSYQWYRADNATGSGAVAVSGATQSAYTQVDADRGKFLSCEVKVTNSSAWTGAVRSGWYGPSLTTFSAKVSLEGEAKLNTALTAKVTESNAQGETLTYKWERSSDNSLWTTITGAMGATYTTTSLDLKTYVRCVVSAPAARYTGTVASSGTGPIKGVLSGTVTLSGQMFANQTLTASVKDLPSGTVATYRWYAVTDEAGSNKVALAGASGSASFDLSKVDAAKVVGKRVLCEVTDSSGAYAGTLTSTPSGVVGIASGTSGAETGGCSWSIDAGGALSIAPRAGEAGQLGSLQEGSVPWQPWASQVSSLTVAKGVKAGEKLSHAFAGCTALASADLSQLDTSAVRDMSSAFEGCAALAILKVPDAFVGASCTSVARLFFGCNALQVIPANFSFGPNKSVNTSSCFTYTGGAGPLATTYLGTDQEVAGYGWSGDGRTLVAWVLGGSVSIQGGDDPCADTSLGASATLTGPSAGLSPAYQWYTASQADDTNPQVISGATSATYVPREADVGKFLICVVSVPADSGAQGTLRAVTAKAVRAPQVCVTVPALTRVIVDSQGNVSSSTARAYAVGAYDDKGNLPEADIALVQVKLTLGTASYPEGSWTLGQVSSDGVMLDPALLKERPFTLDGTLCTVTDAPAIQPGKELPLTWEATFPNAIGPELGNLLADAEGKEARYGSIEFKVAWRPRA